MFSPFAAMAATIALELPDKTYETERFWRTMDFRRRKMSFFAVCAVKNEIYAAPAGMGRMGWAICSLSIGMYIED